MARGSVLPTVLTFLTENADRPITMDEIVESLGVNRGSLSSALIRIGERYPNLSKKTKSSWVWSSVAPEREEQIPGELLLKVIQAKDGKILAQDEENQKMYVLTELEF
jgi:hypothetical protein